MNVTKRHKLSIIVNGEVLEVESQDKINLRINNTVYNPEKISVTQSEYSFSFNVPQTPKNNRIFGFANVPSVKGKFVKQFNAYVYADNVEIFNGLLRISSISEGNYKCNLISMKNSSIDEIFGDSKMNEIRWEVPYVGTATQNAVNQQDNPDYFYPMVAYGVFQKDPYLKVTSGDNSITYYTGTNILDNWVKYYAETFVPSPKLIAIIKKMIEQKGYTYSGDVFTDDLINKLYLSSSIANEQDPAYNIGGTRGRCSVSFNYTVDEIISKQATKRGGVGTTYGRGRGSYDYRSLTYPEDYHYLLNGEKRDECGDDTASMHSLWGSKATSVEADNKDMWENGFIVIPHSGYYKIRMNISIGLSSTQGTTVKDSYPKLKSTRESDRTYELEQVRYERPLNLDNIPVDVQLVKNDSTELEFIATNKINYQRNPTSDRKYDYGYSDYPHEAPYSYTTRGNFPSGSSSNISDYYYQPIGRTRGYDRRVNENFVIGMSTSANAFGIIKKGRSWDKGYSDYGYNSYNCKGYSKYTETTTGAESSNETDYQNYSANGMPWCVYNKLSSKQHYGEGYAIVWLEKNDILSLKALTKEYKTYEDVRGETKARYDSPKYTISGTVVVEAFSPKKNDIDKNWNSASSFDTNLNLGNFLNKDETQKDFFNNFLTTFNLSCNVENGNIEINKNVVFNSSSEAVEVDNRVNVKDVETEIIEFPTSIQVKWTTSDDESGFYHSVPDEHINDDDWKEWADVGTEKVSFVKNDFNNNDISKTSKFSYNWWMDFSLTDYFVRLDGQGGDSSLENINHIENGNVTLSLPIIAKDEDFIDGADYEEMMKKDGRSLKQRLWFKGEHTQYCLPNRNYSKYDTNGNLKECTEYLDICVPTKYYQGKDVLNFTNDKDSLLMRYFNVNENVDSNYATIEVYLTPQEYMRIKNGAMVRFDNDRYQICSITGYDPSGGNKTKLKLMKL